MTSTYKSAVVQQLKPLLAVSDIQRSVEFYRDWLGFNLTGEAENDGKMFWCSMGGNCVTFIPVRVIQNAQTALLS